MLFFKFTSCYFFRKINTPAAIASMLIKVGKKLAEIFKSGISPVNTIKIANNNIPRFCVALAI